MTKAFDITPFIEAESDRITADDLIGGPRTFTIEKIEGAMQEGKRRMVIHLSDSPGKPFMPCKGMVRLLGQLWGADAATWVGRGITLFRDPDVRFGADLTGGVRIAAVSHISQPQVVAVRASQKKIKSHKVEPLKVEPKADDAKAAADKIAATIARAPDAAMLAQYLTGANVKARIEAWRTDRPDLAALIDAARDAKLASLGGDDDDPFGLEEGGATEGEAEEAPPSDDWLAKIDGCKTLAALGKVEAEWFACRDSHAAPERIDAAFDTMREALKRRVAA